MTLGGTVWQASRDIKESDTGWLTWTARVKNTPASEASFFTLKSMMSASEMCVSSASVVGLGVQRGTVITPEEQQCLQQREPEQSFNIETSMRSEIV